MAKLGLLQIAGQTSSSNVHADDILVCTTHATQTLHVGPPTAEGMSPLAIHADRIRVSTAFRYAPASDPGEPYRSGSVVWNPNQLALYTSSNIWRTIALEDAS